MSDSRVKNKLIIDKLLNTYSIDAIISSFHAIDDKIITIIKFSSEDFIHLNSIFRKYHQEINLISAKSLRLFTGFNENLNHKYATDIVHSIDLLYQNLQAFEGHIELNKKVHEQVLQKLEQLYIPVNNFYQNLNTLKLLSASLKPDFITNGKHGGRINGYIEDLFTSYPNFIANLKRLKKFVSNSYVAIDSLKKNYLDNAFHILLFCKNITKIIRKKQDQAREFNPVLENILCQAKERSSVIITNLQYQDIVKQKIEHVRQIHNEIIKKLSVLVEKTDQPDYELTRAKLFLQIKEIALLQSAQMVYANSEYQKAVEVITAELINLSDCIDEINTMYVSYSTPDKTENETGFDADLNIRREVNLYNEIDAINSIFILQTEGIIQRIKNFSDCFTRILKTCSDFRDIINTIKQQQQPQDRDESASVIKHMSTVAEELVKTITYIKSVSDENCELTSILQHKYTEDYLGNKFESIQKQEVKTLSNAFREINYLNREILQTLNAKGDPVNISAELRESIASVRYYEHFENEVTHIISCLDDISNKMKAGDAVKQEDEKVTMDTLRNRYTMDSEHKIHDFIIKNTDKGSNDLLIENLHSVQNRDEDLSEIF